MAFDAVILPNGGTRITHGSEVSIEGQDIIVIQAKAHRLGMYLMGQALFSRELVIVCTQGPYAPRRYAQPMIPCSAPLLEAHDDLEVVVAPKGLG